MARIFISHSSADNDQASRMKAWLASVGFESAFLDKDKTTGIPPGADWERTLYREVEQSQAVVIIQTPNWLVSKWCFAEFTQARALGKAIFPVIEAPTGDTLISPDIQALNLISDRDGGLERLKRQLVRIALDAQGGFAWDAKRPPFPGLLAFQEDDSAVYFGRDDDIRRLIERLEARRNQGGAKLIALLGSSGSGKSSLLRAGVIPRLKRAGRNWIVIPTMRPRVHPVDELASALAAARNPPADWAKVRDDLLGRDPIRALDEFARSLRGEAQANEAQLLISIDQAEELFGVADPDEGRRFLAALSQALSESLPFMAVMTIRSDFLGQIQSAAALTVRFEEFSLGPMPLARVPQIIEGPARVAGLKVDEAFVQQAAGDAETEDALPLLAFALRQLWDRPDKTFSLQAYKALGDEAAHLTPLENAVRKAADAVLAEAKPTDEERMALREAFVPALVRVNEQGEYVRRPARMDALPPKAHGLLKRLADARLLILRDEGVVEVAHEALLRKWPWLKEQLDAERVFLIGKQQLEQDLRDWQAAEDKDKADALLTGVKLTRARTWLVEHPTRLTAEERAFIQVSMEREEAEKRNRERRRRNTTRAWIAAAIVLFLLLAGALWQWSNARKSETLATQQSHIAQSRELAVSATSQLPFDPELSMLLARAAAERSPTPESESALRVALLKSLVRVVIKGDGGGLWSAAYTPDGSRLLLAGEDNIVRIANASSGNAIGKLSGHSARVYNVAVSPNGADAVTASDDGTARLWNLATAREVAQIPMHRGVITHAAFSPDSRLAVLVSDGNSARVWDTTTGKAISELRGHEAPVTSAAFSPDGAWLITGSDDTTARVWDARTGETVAVLPGSTAVTQVLFSPDGRLAATVTPDQRSVHLWKVGSWNPVSNVNTDYSIVWAVFSPDGSRLALVESLGFEIHVWDTRTGSKLADCVGHTGRIFSAAFSPDSMRLVTGSEDKTARVWNAATGSTIVELRGHRGIVTNAQFNPDGTQVATSSLDGTARIWEAAIISDSRELKPSERVKRAGFSPDGTLVWVTGSNEGAIFTAADANLRLEVPRHPDTIADLAFSPNQRSFATASHDGVVRVWLWPDGTQVAELAGHLGAVTRAAFSANGTLLLTSTGDDHALLWNVEKKSAITTLSGRADEAGAAAFSPDSGQVVTVNEDTAIVWNTRTGERMASLHATKDYGVTAAAFSRDGRLVVTSSVDKIVRLWDVATARLLREMKGHTDAVIGAWFSADGKLVASVGQDQTARVWDAATGDQLTELRGDRDNWEMVSFNPSGTLILTGGGHNPITLWDARTGAKLVEFGAEASAATFSPDGRQLLLALEGSARLYRCVECGNVGELVLLAHARATRDLNADERRAFLHER